MHSIVWVLILILILILGAPFLALGIWLSIGSRTGNVDPWRRVRLGKYGFWIILAIFYTVMFATALVEHKL
jgi:hypothetical protein